MLLDERERGLDRLDYYLPIAEKALLVKQGLRDLLHGLKRGGARIAAYGAAAKGATLLNYCALGTEAIEYVVDRSEHKQGRYMPGIHLPIRPPDVLSESPPEYLVILPWNLADEIVRQQAAYRASGGQFILPVPSPRVLEQSR